VTVGFARAGVLQLAKCCALHKLPMAGLELGHMGGGVPAVGVCAVQVVWWTPNTNTETGADRAPPPPRAPSHACCPPLPPGRHACRAGANEVVGEEFEGDVREGRTDLSARAARFSKFGCLLAGVAMIAACGLLPDPHDHGHAHVGQLSSHHGHDHLFSSHQHH
jgi:hypothetical protein